MLLRSVGIASALALTIGVASSNAATLYDQPAIFPGSNTFNALTSIADPVHGDIFTSYDNFTLNTAASVYNVTFQGFAFDTSNNQPTNTQILGFNIAFYADNSGEPGRQLASSAMVGYTSTVAGTVDFFNNGYTETVNDYTVGLLSAFAASAGTTYWISIQAVMASPAYWAWTQGTDGDSTSYQEYGGSFRSFDSDRAFGLEPFVASPPVPEPSSFLMAATAAMAGLGALRGRRRPSDKGRASASGIPS